MGATGLLGMESSSGTHSSFARDMLRRTELLCGGDRQPGGQSWAERAAGKERPQGATGRRKNRQGTDSFLPILTPDSIGIRF